MWEGFGKHFVHQNFPEIHSPISVPLLYLYRCKANDTNIISFAHGGPQQALKDMVHFYVVPNSRERKELLLCIECELIVPIVRHEQLSGIWWYILWTLVFWPYLKNAVGSGFISSFLLKSWLLVEHMLIIPVRHDALLNL